ncbi:hypothetical protein SY88_10595 [Clostridiales bacterium PH28_bin88]|nr:hypothetical protein SY88_10595 [Clostridiales bacterium PH28_bin88]
MEEKKAELSLRLKTLEQALVTLEEALAQPFSVIVRDATIQRFEYTFELAWKLFRKVARIEGVEVNSPRQAIRAAYDAGLLKDIDLWFELLEDRNRTFHTYDESTATQVFESAGRLPATLRSAIKIIRHNYLR